MAAIRYLLLFMPLFLAYLASAEFILSYIIAWLGSFWVFYFSMSGNLKPLPNDRSLFEQAMRPIVLPHIIFAGYTACTSIFFFVSELGYVYFDRDIYYVIDWQKIETMAQCQRYYLAGHTFYVIGIISFMNYRNPEYHLNINKISGFTLKWSVYLIFAAFLAKFVPGFSQIEQIISGVSIAASILSLAYALPEKEPIPIALSGMIFFSNFIYALTSGWKEAIIVPIILLSTYLYQNYKKLVSIGAPLILILYFTYVPTYNSIVRSMAWNGEMQGKEVMNYAINEIKSGNVDIGKNNWEFLTDRLTEMGMFIKYVQFVPLNKDFYGFTIIQQAIECVIPRVFNPNKPLTEKLVMQRVIEVGIVSELSIVSAKPAFIVDSYISYGFLGVVIGCFLLGAFLSFVSCKAEALFGGYIIGSGLMFTGIFMPMWRANCFEFVAVNVVWGYIFLIIFFKLFKSLGILQKI